MLVGLAPVVQKVETAIQWINLYPVDSAIGSRNTYPLDSAIQRLNNRALIVKVEMHFPNNNVVFFPSCDCSILKPHPQCVQKPFRERMCIKRNDRTTYIY